MTEVQAAEMLIKLDAVGVKLDTVAEILRVGFGSLVGGLAALAIWLHFGRSF